jgi:hypothetical protein
VEVAARLAALDWEGLERDLWAWGWAKTPAVLTPQECDEVVFAEPGDLSPLGARTLEGLNLTAAPPVGHVDSASRPGVPS